MQSKERVPILITFKCKVPIEANESEGHTEKDKEVIWGYEVWKQEKQAQTRAMFNQFDIDDSLIGPYYEEEKMMKEIEIDDKVMSTPSWFMDTYSHINKQVSIKNHNSSSIPLVNILRKKFKVIMNQQRE